MWPVYLKIPLVVFTCFLCKCLSCWPVKVIITELLNSSTAVLPEPFWNPHASRNKNMKAPFLPGTEQKEAHRMKEEEEEIG